MSDVTQAVYLLMPRSVQEAWMRRWAKRNDFTAYDNTCERCDDCSGCKCCWPIGRCHSR